MNNILEKKQLFYAVSGVKNSGKTTLITKLLPVLTRRGLPIGLQLLGDCFKEEHIIRAAYAYECSRGRTALAGKRD